MYRHLETLPFNHIGARAGSIGRESARDGMNTVQCTRKHQLLIGCKLRQAVCRALNQLENSVVRRIGRTCKVPVVDEPTGLVDDLG